MTIIHVNGLITTTSSFKENRNNSKIITFSHVLTSKKLMKAYIDEMSLRRQKWLDSRKVAGTELLNEQLKLIKPQVHIFAHSQNGIGYWSCFKENRNNSKIITFSHFLTSKKLMKAYIDEMPLRRQKWFDSRKVAGTELLNEQLKLIKPQVHIFAHSQNGIGYWSWYSIYK
ncbi:unnamed protein product [Rotaria socialis]